MPARRCWQRRSGFLPLGTMWGWLAAPMFRPIPAVVVVNPDDEVTPEAFAAWLDRRQVGEPVDPGVKAADTLAEARAAGEV